MFFAINSMSLSTLSTPKTSVRFILLFLQLYLPHCFSVTDVLLYFNLLNLNSPFLQNSFSTQGGDVMQGEACLGFK